MAKVVATSGRVAGVELKDDLLANAAMRLLKRRSRTPDAPRFVVARQRNPASYYRGSSACKTSLPLADEAGGEGAVVAGLERH